MNVLEAVDIFGNSISLSRERWEHSFRHKVESLGSMEDALKNPIEVRRSRYDEEVNLYYGEADSGFVCVVVQIVDGFILTAYKTESKKEGKLVWKRDR